MRKLVLIGLTLTAMSAVTAVAVAQYAMPVMTANGSIVAAKKGKSSKKKPKNATVNVGFNINPESRTTIDSITFTLPKDIRLDGTGFRTCAADAINASGPSVCRKGSQVGTGTAQAVLGGPNPSPLNFTVTIYAGGRKSLTLFLETALFNIAIPATIVGQKVIVPIPERVYRPVGGLYAYVTSVNAKLGPAKVRTRKGRKRKTRYFASLRGCSSKTHAFSVTVTTRPNPNPPPVPSLTASATSPCRR